MEPIFPPSSSVNYFHLTGNKWFILWSQFYSLGWKELLHVADQDVLHGSVLLRRGVRLQDTGPVLLAQPPHHLLHPGLLTVTSLSFPSVVPVTG